MLEALKIVSESWPIAAMVLFVSSGAAITLSTKIGWRGSVEKQRLQDARQLEEMRIRQNDDLRGRAIEEKRR